MQSTLKREFKDLEVVEREAVSFPNCIKATMRLLFVCGYSHFLEGNSKSKEMMHRFL